MIRALAFAALVAAPSVASAQALRCTIPGSIATPHPDVPSAREPRRVLPIGSYTLAITWSPQFCYGKQGRAAGDVQCGGANRFGFTLHGLWPDGEGKTWPQYCAPAPILSQPEIRKNLCATPSAQLLQHEYAKHGTCMGVPPAQYFARSTSLYAKLRYPDMDALSRRGSLTAGAFAAAFARANPGMSPRMLRVTATKSGWLDEVWLCLDTRFRRTICPAHQGGLPASAPLRIWRGGR